MRTRLVVACVATLVFVSACGSADDLASNRRTSKAPTPSATPGKKYAGPVDKSLPKVVGEVRAFSSPTRNIGCEITKDAARCDIDTFTYGPPTKPADCNARWGRSLRVSATSATFLCASDTTLGPTQILAYGTSSVVGDFGCTSARTGVTCLNTTSKHGFVISRERVGTF